MFYIEGNIIFSSQIMKIINKRKFYFNIYLNIGNCLLMIYILRNYEERVKDFLSVHSTLLQKGTEKNCFVLIKGFWFTDCLVVLFGIPNTWFATFVNIFNESLELKEKKQKLSCHL